LRKGEVATRTRASTRKTQKKNKTKTLETNNGGHLVVAVASQFNGRWGPEGDPAAGRCHDPIFKGGIIVTRITGD